MKFHKKGKSHSRDTLSTGSLHDIPDFREKSSSILRCQIAYNRYGGYCIPHSSSHRPAAKRTLAGEVWEPETIEFMTSHCGSGDVVHAGAYFGDFLPALARACGDGAKVFAFEPNYENYRCASVTMLLNDLKNIELSNMGLGSQNGWETMKITDSDGVHLGGGSRMVESIEDDRIVHEQVRMVRLDEVIPNSRIVTLLQLDVEGFEQEALSGAMGLIKRCSPIIILETLPETSWLEANVFSLGYTIKRLVHRNTVLVLN